MFYQDNPRPDECLCPHVLKHTHWVWTSGEGRTAFSLMGLSSGDSGL